MTEVAFLKVHSLGNDLILFDWRSMSAEAITAHLHDPSWPSFVKKLCQRHFGVGADGVLVLTDSPLQMRIFNEDGSQAEACLNGLRCVADYLLSHDPSSRSVQIQVGQRTCLCSLEDGEVVSDVGPVELLGHNEVVVAHKSLVGHRVNVGNPHFVIMERTTENWLARHGKRIESHELFPQRTNVEFVWPSTTSFSYHVLIYERGCGPTLACGSGAAAITGLFVRSGRVSVGQKVTLHMPGGQLTSWVEPNGHVMLRAKAQKVFSGVLS